MVEKKVKVMRVLMVLSGQKKQLGLVLQTLPSSQLVAQRQNNLFLRQVSRERQRIRSDAAQKADGHENGKSPSRFLLFYSSVSELVHGMVLR